MAAGCRERDGWRIFKQLKAGARSIRSTTMADQHQIATNTETETDTNSDTDTSSDNNTNTNIDSDTDTVSWSRPFDVPHSFRPFD